MLFRGTCLYEEEIYIIVFLFTCRIYKNKFVRTPAASARITRSKNSYADNFHSANLTVSNSKLFNDHRLKIQQPTIFINIKNPNHQYNIRCTQFKKITNA